MTRRSAAERAGEFDAPAAAEAAAEEDRRAAAVVERNMVTWDEASIGSSRSFRKSAASFRKSKLQSERSHRRLLRELRSQMSMSASRLTKMIADHGKEELAREIITFRELPHQPMYVPPLTSALVNSLYSGVADKKKHHRLYAEAMTASLVVRHGYQPTWDKTVRLGTRLGYSRASAHARSPTAHPGASLPPFRARTSSTLRSSTDLATPRAGATRRSPGGRRPSAAPAARPRPRGTPSTRREGDCRAVGGCRRRAPTIRRRSRRRRSRASAASRPSTFRRRRQSGSRPSASSARRAHTA